MKIIIVILWGLLFFFFLVFQDMGYFFLCVTALTLLELVL